jgi:hypothetical protein
MFANWSIKKIKLGKALYRIDKNFFCDGSKYVPSEVDPRRKAMLPLFNA